VTRPQTGRREVGIRAIDQRRADWIAVLESGDAGAYAGLVTEDVVWMPPHGPAIVGRAAFREWIAPFFEAYEYEFSVDGIRTRESERWIAETGEFESRMIPRDGGSPATHGGRYLLLWRRDGDVWRIERYVDLGSLAR
jgi:uncharacterized protein (TIGR02246 family)